jgi:hypothetical protein
VIGNIVFDTELAEPAIGKVYLNLSTNPSLGADRKYIPAAMIDMSEAIRLATGLSRADGGEPKWNFWRRIRGSSSRITANSGPSSVVSQNARNPSALGNSETYRSPARRKFAAAIADPDGDKRFPLLSVRSLRAVTSQPPVQPEKAMHDSRAKNENVQ